MVMALADALHTLLRLPGATYACVVERDSGRVLAELGQGEASTGDSEGVVAYSVPRWGTAVAAMFGATSGDELDDVMITGRRSYHLVRPLGAGAAVLVYLRLDRSRSNLAAARRELAAVRLAGGAGTPDQAAAPPAPASARTRDDASAPAARRPVAATSPAPPARVPASLAPPTTPARGLRGPAAEPPAAEPAAAGRSRPSSRARRHRDACVRVREGCAAGSQCLLRSPLVRCGAGPGLGADAEPGAEPDAEPDAEPPDAEPHRRLAVGAVGAVSRAHPDAGGRRGDASDPAARGGRPAARRRMPVRRAGRRPAGERPPRPPSPRPRGSPCPRSSASAGPRTRARSVAFSRVSAG